MSRRKNGVFFFLSRILACVFLSACAVGNPGTGSAENPIETVAGTSTSESKHIRLASGEWIPYTGENLPEYGCDSQIISEVFRQMGYTVEYGFFPWARAMHFAEIGEWDGTVDWGDTPAFREKFFINKDPISNQEMSFFFVKGNAPEWNTLDDLEGKKIGITSGYVYDDVFKHNIEKGNLTFVEASSDEANFKKLLAGRIDLFPIDRNVGLALLKSKFKVEEQDQLEFDSKVLVTFHPHLLLSKALPRNRELMAQFDDFFGRMRETQLYTDLVNKCRQ